MSQTGADTRHSDADGASNAIEERLQVIIDAIPAIVWRKLPDGSADFLNQYFREYTGLSLEEGMGLGRPFRRRRVFAGLTVSIAGS
jgi:PAS domain-containing protein